MKISRTLSGLALVTSLFMVLAIGCASSSQLEQPPTTSYMKSAVGTSNELSPMAPPEAKNIRKVGNQWQCEINGQKMRYNPAGGNWEPMMK
jgi:hypothetical protein